jgi:hypothetical protein
MLMKTVYTQSNCQNSASGKECETEILIYSKISKGRLSQTTRRSKIEGV